MRSLSVVTLSITANEYLFHLSQWFIANSLSLNLDKTCFVTFGKHQEDDFDIRIGNIKIINVNHCRYLGVYIDKDLKWIEHINQLRNKLQKYAGIFRGFDKGCLINVLRVFILPCLSTIAPWH